jgi:hypothetical protein
MSLVLANGDVVDEAYIKQHDDSVWIREPPLNVPETFELNIHTLTLHLLPEEINRLAPVVRNADYVQIDCLKNVDYSTVIPEPTVARYVFTHFVREVGPARYGVVDVGEDAPTITYYTRRDHALVSSRHLVIPIFP